MTELFESANFYSSVYQKRNQSKPTFKDYPQERNDQDKKALLNPTLFTPNWMLDLLSNRPRYREESGSSNCKYCRRLQDCL